MVEAETTEWTKNVVWASKPKCSAISDKKLAGFFTKDESSRRRKWQAKEGQKEQLLRSSKKLSVMLGGTRGDGAPGWWRGAFAGAEGRRATRDFDRRRRWRDFEEAGSRSEWRTAGLKFLTKKIFFLISRRRYRQVGIHGC